MKLILEVTVEMTRLEFEKDVFTGQPGERLLLTLLLDRRTLNVRLGEEDFRLPAVLQLDITEGVLDYLELEKPPAMPLRRSFLSQAQRSIQACRGDTGPLCLTPGDGGLRRMDEARGWYAMDFRYELPVTFLGHPIQGTLSVPLRRAEGLEPVDPKDFSLGDLIF